MAYIRRQGYLKRFVKVQKPSYSVAELEGLECWETRLGSLLLKTRELGENETLDSTWKWKVGKNHGTVL